MRIIDRHLGSLSRAAHPQYIAGGTATATTNTATTASPVDPSSTTGDTAPAVSPSGAALRSREQLVRDRLMQSNVQVPFERHLWNEPPLTRHVRQLYKFHGSSDSSPYAGAGSEMDEPPVVEDSRKQDTSSSSHLVEDDIVALDDAYLGELGLVEDPSYLYYT